MKKTLLILIAIVGFYLIYSNIGKTFEEVQQFEKIAFESFGDSVSKKNVVALQTFVSPGDYASEDRFYKKMEYYFENAKSKNWLIPNQTTVVLPEFVGTWLVAANEKSSVYGEKTVDAALKTMVTSNLFGFIKTLIFAPKVEDKVKHSVFALKGATIAEIYQSVFSKLAKKYKVTVVAGSLLLPKPFVKNGILKTTKNGELYNISAVFGPDGVINAKIIKKAYPIADEQPFVCKADSNANNVFETPAGNLGVLICADAWHPNQYYNLKKDKASFVVVPSYSNGNKIWQQSWRGYSGSITSNDAKNDIGKITLGEAWVKYAMAMRAKNDGGIQNGLNVFLQGNLWDLGTDGTTIILSNGVGKTTSQYGGAQIINLWI